MFRRLVRLARLTNYVRKGVNYFEFGSLETFDKPKYWNAKIANSYLYDA